MWLRSDNTAGIDPEILSAIVKANGGVDTPYGGDRLSESLNEAFSAFFETPVEVFPVPSGTAANALALASSIDPYDMIVCHQGAHPLRDECGATSFYAGGVQFIPIGGDHGRMDADRLEDSLRSLTTDGMGTNRPKAVTLTQLSEAGTVYRPSEIEAISRVAHANGMTVHMDGARFANAAAALNISPADATWRLGVDVMSFGATKNGAMCADAVVYFSRGHAQRLKPRMKRAGLVMSKARFMAAQLLSYIEADRWLRNARQANSVAQALARAIEALPGSELVHPVDGNIVFAAIDKVHVDKLRSAGLEPRAKGCLSDEREVYRLVASFLTEVSEVDRLTRVLQG